LARPFGLPLFDNVGQAFGPPSFLQSGLRTFAEIRFRLRQEAANLRLFLHPPEAPETSMRPRPDFHPAPADVALAESILEHRFPLLGVSVDTGPDIHWRRDYLHNVSTPLRYFRFIPYLDFHRAGDHKIIWELNRHQHWVVLAQAWRATGRREFLDEIRSQFESWSRQNPPLRGINWASALEVAFRALSWTWVYHLAGEDLDPLLRRRFLTGLYRHGCYLEHSLSVYFSPNTHLLGEAVALHALGALFPGFPRRWEERGARLVREQMDFQVRADGSHFEQSSYYQVYALDMFLFHRMLAPAPPEFDARLARMAAYLADLMGPQRTLPFLGDDDGGRFFHPYGSRDCFGRDTLAGAGVTTPAGSKLYPDAGIAILAAGDVHVIVDAGPFGSGSAGHSHSDTLSLVVRAGDEEILIDPGTYTYVGDPQWRDWFRGSAAHNTVRIDGRDQGLPAGPFRWSAKPEVELLQWETRPDLDFLDAVCRYGGFSHRRRVVFVKPSLLLVVDEIEGPGGERLVEQYWHPGAETVRLSPSSIRIGTRAALTAVDRPLELQQGWRSPALLLKVPAPVALVSQKATLPVLLGAIIDLAGAAIPNELRILRLPGAELELHFQASVSGVLRLPRQGLPDLRHSGAGSWPPAPSA
jgi:hypothetical protein